MFTCKSCPSESTHCHALRKPDEDIGVSDAESICKDRANDHATDNASGLKTLLKDVECQQMPLAFRVKIF